MYTVLRAITILYIACKMKIFDSSTIQRFVTVCVKESDDYQVFRPDKSNEEHRWQNLKKIFQWMHFLNRSQWKTVFLFNDGNAYLQTRRISAGINSLTTRRSVFAKVQEHEFLNICKISLSRKSMFWWIKSNKC